MWLYAFLSIFHFSSIPLILSLSHSLSHISKTLRWLHLKQSIFAFLWGESERMNCAEEKLEKSDKKRKLDVAPWGVAKKKWNRLMQNECRKEKRKKSCWGLQKKERKKIRLANLKITREIIFILNHFDATHLFRIFLNIFCTLLTTRKTYFLTVLDSAQLKFIVFSTSSFRRSERERESEAGGWEKYRFGIEENFFPSRKYLFIFDKLMMMIHIARSWERERGGVERYEARSRFGGKMSTHDFKLLLTLSPSYIYKQKCFLNAFHSKNQPQ